MSLVFIAPHSASWKCPKRSPTSSTIPHTNEFGLHCSTLSILEMPEALTYFFHHLCHGRKREFASGALALDLVPHITDKLLGLSPAGKNLLHGFCRNFACHVFRQ